jgi:hypothetical protein
MARLVGWNVALVTVLCNLTFAAAAGEQSTEPPYRVETLATGLKFPWSLVFLPNGEALLTEKFGELRILRKGVLNPAPVTGGPQNILQEGDSGLLDGWPKTTFGVDYSDGFETAKSRVSPTLSLCGRPRLRRRGPHFILEKNFRNGPGIFLWAR